MAVSLVLTGAMLYSVLLLSRVAHDVERLSDHFSGAFGPLITVDDISVKSKSDNGNPRLSIKFEVKNLGNAVANDLSVIVSTWIDKKNWIDKENPKIKQSSASLLFPGNGLNVEADIYTSNGQYGKDAYNKFIEEINSKEILCQIIVRYENKIRKKECSYRALYKLNSPANILILVRNETD